MSTTATETKQPRVWVGCISCYSAGHLVGDWYNAIDAVLVTPEDLHNGATTHEELWCYDCEHMLYDYQMDPTEATQQAQCLASADVHERGALRAWIASGAVIEDHNTGLPDILEFHDRYRGEWDDFLEFADDYRENIGLLDGFPIELTKYFDREKYARDLERDYTTWPTEDGQHIHVFSDN